MDLSAPWSPLLAPGTAAVLGVLAGTSGGLTGRTVARLAGMSPAGGAAVLVRLVDHGLVDAEPVGAAFSYRLVREHLLAGPVLGLLRAGDALEGRLAEEITGWAVPCAGCAMFGSAARRDGSTLSDLDLLLLRPQAVALDGPAWRAQLDATADAARCWTGNPVSWTELGTDSFAAMVAADDPLVAQLRRDARWLVSPAPPLGTVLSAPVGMA